jgi:uncharacterized Zn-binding protein involved in type VI secretion
MRTLAKDGDPTTTRGQVIASSYSSRDQGRNIALDGDQATCGDCGPGSWPIVGSATHMRFNGRAAVQDGDWVTCPCHKNHVIATSNTMRNA